MRVADTIRVDNVLASDRDFKLGHWLFTNVGIQTISWEWLYDSSGIYINFYKKEDADKFRLAFL